MRLPPASRKASSIDAVSFCPETQPNTPPSTPTGATDRPVPVIARMRPNLLAIYGSIHPRPGAKGAWVERPGTQQASVASWDEEVTMSESQKVTRQEALTSDSGRTWLIVAGVIAALCLVMLWFMRELPPLGAATTGMVAIVIAYLAMIAIRFGVARSRLKLGLLAVLTIAIVLIFMTVGWITVFAA